MLATLKFQYYLSRHICLQSFLSRDDSVSIQIPFKRLVPLYDIFPLNKPWVPAIVGWWIVNWNASVYSAWRPWSELGRQCADMCIVVEERWTCSLTVVTFGRCLESDLRWLGLPGPSQVRSGGVHLAKRGAAPPQVRSCAGAWGHAARRQLCPGGSWRIIAFLRISRSLIWWHLNVVAYCFKIISSPFGFLRWFRRANFASWVSRWSGDLPCIILNASTTGSFSICVFLRIVFVSCEKMERTVFDGDPF